MKGFFNKYFTAKLRKNTFIFLLFSFHVFLAYTQYGNIYFSVFFGYVNTIVLVFFSAVISKFLLKVIYSFFIASLWLIFKEYDYLSVGLLSSLLSSDPSEMYEFLAAIELVTYFQVIMTFILMYYILDNIDFSDFNVRIYFILIIFIFSTISYLKYKKSDYRYTEINYYNDNFSISRIEKSILDSVSITYIGNLFVVIYKYINLNNSGEIKSEWGDVTINKKSDGIYVLIIGESARKNNFQVYGYNRYTSFDDAGMRMFNGVISPSVITRFSVPRILSLNYGPKDYNLNMNVISLANKSKFKTYWISNQSKGGIHDSEISLLANQADFIYFNNFDYKQAKTDNDLLVPIRDAIRDTDQKNKVIFVHTIGSHHDFCKRTAIDMMIELNKNRSLNCYNNSILSGMKFIESIKKSLHDAHEKVNIIYLSDHGLVRGNDKKYYIHDLTLIPKKESVEVPFIVVSDDIDDKNQVNVQYNLRDFYATFADWTGIITEDIDYSKSIFRYVDKSEDFDIILNASYDEIKIY